MAGGITAGQYAGSRTPTPSPPLPRGGAEYGGDWGANYTSYGPVKDQSRIAPTPHAPVPASFYGALPASGGNIDYAAGLSRNPYDVQRAPTPAPAPARASWPNMGSLPGPDPYSAGPALPYNAGYRPRTDTSHFTPPPRDNIQGAPVPQPRPPGQVGGPVPTPRARPVTAAPVPRARPGYYPDERIANVPKAQLVPRAKPAAPAPMPKARPLQKSAKVQAKPRARPAPDMVTQYPEWLRYQVAQGNMTPREAQMRSRYRATSDRVTPGAAGAYGQPGSGGSVHIDPYVTGRGPVRPTPTGQVTWARDPVTGAFGPRQVLGSPQDEARFADQLTGGRSDRSFSTGVGVGSFR